MTPVARMPLGGVIGRSASGRREKIMRRSPCRLSAAGIVIGSIDLISRLDGVEIRAQLVTRDTRLRFDLEDVQIR